ncbi:CHAT domain-containing protein [Alloactinosynnema sp. L-07]|uniref:CHAT domain-containing protein n=1 Tax=Alloactinosynnema sp. L-07 TaxID=1653480 RepID=UPI001E30B3B3|nr:CHAT domain-containing protein [Alloactinosynnema sp. L-07]
MTRTVLVEYAFLGRELVVFGVRADWERPRVAVVPVDRAELASFVESHFGSGDQVRDMVDLGMEDVWLGHAALVAPIAAWAEPGDVVYLVPHNLLHYLPLHALPVDGTPLIERNPVVYSPSTSILSKIPSRVGGRERAAVFGDSRGDLAHANAEAKGLGALLETDPVLGPNVTRAAVLQGFATADIVHIAGHGMFDVADAMGSGVLLADGDLLTAADVFGLPPVRASLVTLSGCETGVSRNRLGDELIGLTRAFLYARTSAMLVSLWTVADSSTAYLMGRFYQHLRDGAASTAHALQRAALDTRSSPGWSSLYHWAPFVLIGDWR